ncbi:addiction module protein [Aeoliella sp. SH292]|uniref:addiction module protein n=1 Tax=Aeoliella sp. SH292 TaxID=3454464 RepID=UPI003F9597E4
MSLDEKLEEMEALWQDISSNGSNYVSPAWHGHELEQRKAAAASGEAKFIDWEVAKREIRDAAS